MGNRVFRRRRNVLIGVPLRSDGSRARRLASYNVGGVRQARQIELHPGFQFAGVETWCLAVSWIESSTRSTSSKPVVFG